MATTRKTTSTGRRRRTAKPGASKAPAKRRNRRVSGTADTLPPTVMVSGVGRYKKSTCHKTITEAKKAAEGKRSKGVRARVLKSSTGYCVYTRGRASSR